MKSIPFKLSVMVLAALFGLSTTVDGYAQRSSKKKSYNKSKIVSKKSRARYRKQRRRQARRRTSRRWNPRSQPWTVEKTGSKITAKVENTKRKYRDKDQVSSFSISCNTNKLLHGKVKFTLALPVEGTFNFSGTAAMKLKVHKWKAETLEATFQGQKSNVNLVATVAADQKRDWLKTFITRLSKRDYITISIPSLNKSVGFRLTGSGLALEPILEDCITKYYPFKTVQPAEGWIYTYRELLNAKYLMINDIKKRILWLSIKLTPDITTRYQTMNAVLEAADQSSDLTFNAGITFFTENKPIREDAVCSQWVRNESICEIGKDGGSFKIKRSLHQLQILEFRLPSNAGDDGFLIDVESDRIPVRPELDRLSLPLKRSW